MTTSARLTKVQLLAKIDAVEAQVAAEIMGHEATKAKLAAARAEIDGLYVAQRPSRVTTPMPNPNVVSADTPVVYLRGVAHYKLRDPNTRIVTYRVVPQH